MRMTSALDSQPEKLLPAASSSVWALAREWSLYSADVCDWQQGQPTAAHWFE